MTGKFTEAELEEAIIDLFRQENYAYVNGESIHRHYEDILLTDDLRAYLSDRYQSAGLSDAEMKKIINKLTLINSTPLYLGSRDAFRLVNEGFDLARDDITKVALHIDYINFDEPEKNIFKVVNQYSVQGEHLRRPDMLVFINVIPVAIFEFKTAIEEDTTVFDAWEQITVRYCRDIPKLMKYCFVSVISKDIQKYYESCAEQGSKPEQIEESKRAMSKMRKILGHPDRLHKLAKDIIEHYEALCAEKPDVVQKAMIVCSDRQIAFDLMKEILSIREAWGIPRKAENEAVLSSEQLDKLLPLPKINLVATQG